MRMSQRKTRKPKSIKHKTRKHKTRKPKSRKPKSRKNKGRNRRNIRGGAAAGGAGGAGEYLISGIGRSSDEKYPLLNDLLEEIAELFAFEKKIDIRDIIHDKYLIRQIRLIAIAKISELDDGSEEAQHKQEVIRYLTDQQAKDASSQHNLIQPEDIQEKIDMMMEEYDEDLDDISHKEIKAIIRQYMERKDL